MPPPPHSSGKPAHDSEPGSPRAGIVRIHPCERNVHLGESLSAVDIVDRLLIDRLDVEVRAVLTPEQQTKWKEMNGAPFKGEIRRQGRGGGRAGA